MPKIKYQSFRFRKETLARIEQVNEIIAEYQAQGFSMTLRQTFYQLVSRGLIPNSQAEYNKLGSVIADARLAGLVDWDAIVDRTRFLRDLAHWSSPQAIVSACAGQFRLDKWARQPSYCEIFIEKDALIGVIEGVCEELDVPYLACRGYASASEIWRAGHQRLKPKLKTKECVVFYLGDHDPSGIDMTRDVQERLNTFAGLGVEVKRLALNWDQVQEHNPPPNPAKQTDSRFDGYTDQFGEECWELDALNPAVIRDLIEAAVLELRDEDLWQEALIEEEEAKTSLARIASSWQDVIDGLS